MTSEVAGGRAMGAEFCTVTENRVVKHGINIQIVIDTLQSDGFAVLATTSHSFVCGPGVRGTRYRYELGYTFAFGVTRAVAIVNNLICAKVMPKRLIDFRGHYSYNIRV